MTVDVNWNMWKIIYHVKTVEILVYGIKEDIVDNLM